MQTCLLIYTTSLREFTKNMDCGPVESGTYVSHAFLIDFVLCAFQLVPSQR